MDAAKVVLRGKVTAIITYTKKEERSQINKLTLHIRNKKRKKSKPKVNRMKEIIRTRKEVEKRKTIETNLKLS